MGIAESSPRTARRSSRRRTPCTSCAGTTSFRRRTRCCARCIAPEVQKALGIKLNVETINANDIPARATSSIQSGNGPDIIMILNNYPHLYASAAVDVSAVADEVGKAQGGIYDAATQLNRIGGKWVSMPWSMVPALIAYRKSWFDEVGAKTFPKTWQEYHGGRQEAEGGEAPDRPDARQHLRRRADLHLSVPVVLRRPGSRRQGQGGARFEGDPRVGALHDAVLEGRARRGRPRLGRQQQQPRLPLRRHQRLAERRLDLRRGAERRGQVQDREGRAAAYRHPARAAARGPEGRARATTPRSTTW